MCCLILATYNLVSSLCNRNPPKPTWFERCLRRRRLTREFRDARFNPKLAGFVELRDLGDNITSSDDSVARPAAAEFIYRFCTATLDMNILDRADFFEHACWDGDMANARRTFTSVQFRQECYKLIGISKHVQSLSCKTKKEECKHSDSPRYDINGEYGGSYYDQ